ncbi:type VI secretion system baseplate subunit TssE [Bradyrhizobium sp. JYMT SZCCT0428]|uniref:type VI secretion system baseplate subunit TssE n=1 Tax=Bradyrhizobium sp. JYMT SZCCT0428 TaxID=2807673 RepID=UPI002012AE0B|nr:type VI secretion system baseplate subunit TssE [Bradyrhizobium sp. JYMT SZCCT0428]
MADRDIKTRLSPPLMYVFRSAHNAKDAQKTVDLRDEAGGRVIADRRLRPRQVITEPALRREVARDLDSLLNTIEMASTIDMGLTPYVRKSILNFGIPDLTRRSIDEAGVDDIPEELKIAILNYEPRLAAASLQIERDNSVDAAELKVRFVVRAELICHPVHVPVEFVADVIDTGKIVINRV